MCATGEVRDSISCGRRDGGEDIKFPNRYLWKKEKTNLFQTPLFEWNDMNFLKIILGSGSKKTVAELVVLSTQ